MEKIVPMTQSCDECKSFARAFSPNLKNLVSFVKDFSEINSKGTNCSCYRIYKVCYFQRTNLRIT